LGASVSLKELQRKFSFEPKHVAAATKEQLARNDQYWTKVQYTRPIVQSIFVAKSSNE